ncbi:MAG: HAD-IIIA family hydrolase [Candidatus Omnitrophica bacterium]|nr:HAD-IIIA family hydrolase [Candidatus Omnitrophota bacterium]
MSDDKKVIFIDRDGVVNEDPGGWTEHGYVTKWEDFHFLPGSKEALRKLNENGYDIVIISNQAGVGKGYYTEEDLESITRNMLDAISESGGRVKGVYYCVHKADDNCDCRKPGTGLFRRAETELGIESYGRYFVGDGKMDVEAASQAGLKSVLVLSGKTKLADVRTWDIQPDFIFDNLYASVNFIINH